MTRRFIEQLGLAIFCLSLQLLTAKPTAAGDPDITFRTINTPHFDIHYEEQLEHTAQLTATIAEEVFEDLTILLRWEIKKKINVVITDNTESPNGSAASRGRPVIRLFATAPLLDNTLASFDHYLRTLFTHELTHIIHINIHGKTSDVINSVFGDVYLPNQMQPKIIIEGLAVLLETLKTSGGRIRSAYYTMYIRTAALENTLLDLAQASNTTRSYLRGTHVYLYGAMFMNYIYQKYGMEKIVEFCHAYGKAVLPYGINRLFLDIFGEEIMTLYKEWIAETKRKAEATRAVLLEDGLTSSMALTTDGESKGRPIFSRDGQSILLPLSNGMVESGVYRIPLNGTKQRPLFLTASNSSVSMDRNGRIYYNRSAPYKNVYRFRDLFTLAEKGSPRRLTRGLRVQYAAVNGRGDRVALVTNKGGTTHLKLADENGNVLKTLLHSKPDDQVYLPAWSPDGTFIVAPIRRGIQVDLARVDVETGAVDLLTNDRKIESAPTFDPSGRYLLFSSDRTGIFNIYAYDFETNQILQVTNVLTGAFFPAISPDGKKLAFIKYRSVGYDLHVMDLNLKSMRLAPPVSREIVEALPTPVPARLPSRRYNPLSTMAPSHWLLNTLFDADWNTTFQAVTAFTDLSSRHRAGVELTYGTENRDVSGRLAYSYSGLTSTVRIGFSRKFSPQTEGYVFEGKEQDWTRIITKGSLGFGLPVFGVDHTHRLNFTYGVIHERPRETLKLTLDPRGERPNVPSSAFRAGIEVGWGFSDMVSSSLGIGAHRGRAISTGVRVDHPTIGGTTNLTTFRYAWTEALPVPWPVSWLEHHTFTIRLYGAVHLSDPPDRWSFAVGGYTPQNIVDTILNNTSGGGASLRGYPPSAFKGSHYHSLKLNYRFPIWFAELGYGTVPFYLRRIQGSIFCDNVVISYDELNRDDWRSSVGGVVSILFSIGYYQYMSLQLGFARGLMDRGGNEFIMVLSGSG